MQALGVVSPWLSEIFVRGVITLVLQVVIIVLMLRRKLARRFPLFFSYILYQVAEGLFRWIVEARLGNASTVYFYAYWYSEVAEIILLFLALGESSWHVFRCFRRMQWFRRWLLISIVGIVSYGVISLWIDPPRKMSPMLAMITRVDLIATFVPTGVAILFSWFVLRYEAWQWFTRETWIIIGLAVVSGSQIVMMGLRAYFGRQVFVATAGIAAWGYVAAELAWIREFLRPDPPPVMTEEEWRLARPLMEEISKGLDQYLEVLKRVRKDM
jgi:hypothetical protein